MKDESTDWQYKYKAVVFLAVNHGVINTLVLLISSMFLIGNLLDEIFKLFGLTRLTFLIISISYVSALIFTIEMIWLTRWSKLKGLLLTYTLLLVALLVGIYL